jgi:hypothetical protein
MPRISNKVQVQNDLNRLFLVDFITATSEDEINEALTYLLLCKDLKKQRYLYSRLAVLKSN